MTKHPILPNWQLPRRQPFLPRRGIALLRALRLRLAEETVERCIQTQFDFARGAGLQSVACQQMRPKPRI